MEIRITEKFWLKLQKDYNELFNDVPVEDQIDESVFDEFMDDEDNENGMPSVPRQRRRSTSGDNQPLQFGTRQARVLSRVLTHCHLPGLTALDQMHLLAVADTVASIGTRLDHNTEMTQKSMHDGTPGTSLILSWRTIVRYCWKTKAEQTS